jgi:hypothetical protein
MANGRLIDTYPKPFYAIKQDFLTWCKSTEEEVIFDIMMTDAQIKMGLEDYTPLTQQQMFDFIDAFSIPDTGPRIKIIKTTFSEIARLRNYDVKAIKHILRDLHERKLIILEEYKTDPDKIRLTLFKGSYHTLQKRGVKVDR